MSRPQQSMIFLVLASLAVVQSVDICDIGCVQGLFASSCGGAKCVFGTEDSGQLQGICSPSCRVAIAGEQLRACLFETEGIQSQGVQGDFSQLVGNLCESRGLDLDVDALLAEEAGSEDTPEVVAVAPETTETTFVAPEESPVEPADAPEAVVEEPVDAPEEAVEQPADAPEEVVEEPVDAPEESEEPVDAPEEVEEPLEEPSEEPMEEPIEEPMEEPAEEPSEEPIEEPSEEPSEEPAEEPADGPMSEEDLEELAEAMLDADI